MTVWKSFGLLAVLAALSLMLAARPAIAAEEAAHVAHEIHAAGEQLAEEVTPPNPLVFDPDLAIFTGIVFVILVLVLGKFAWPQVVAALDEREQNIAGQIAAADAKHEQAKKLLEEHQARLSATAGEVRELLEEARRDAEHTKSRIVAEARQAADEERTRALREIDSAKDGAIHDLATASAKVAIDLARQVVQEQISDQRQDQLVRDALGKLAAAKPSKN